VASFDRNCCPAESVENTLVNVPFARSASASMRTKSCLYLIVYANSRRSVSWWNAVFKRTVYAAFEGGEMGGERHARDVPRPTSIHPRLMRRAITEAYVSVQRWYMPPSEEARYKIARPGCYARNRSRRECGIARGCCALVASKNGSAVGTGRSCSRCPEHYAVAASSQNSRRPAETKLCRPPPRRKQVAGRRCDVGHFVGGERQRQTR